MFTFFFTVLENVIKSTKSGQLIGVANQKMVELLADNIKSEDSSSMLKMVGMPSRSARGSAARPFRVLVLLCSSLCFLINSYCILEYFVLL